MSILITINSNNTDKFLDAHAVTKCIMVMQIAVKRVYIGPTLAVSVGWTLAQCRWPNGVNLVQNDIGPMSGF